LDSIDRQALYRAKRKQIEWKRQKIVHRPILLILMYCVN
jgi:hypothetical protein